MENNTIFDYEQERKELPSKEEILQNEDEMIAGLLEAANFKDNSDFQKKIEIRRNGKLLFSFFVRPFFAYQSDSVLSLSGSLLGVKSVP